MGVHRESAIEDGENVSCRRKEIIDDTKSWVTSQVGMRNKVQQSSMSFSMTLVKGSLTIVMSLELDV